MKKNRIFFLVNNLRSGGAEKLTLETINILNKSFEIKLVCLNKLDEVYQVEKRSNLVYLSNRLKYSLILPIRLFIEALKDKPDIIHVNLFPSLYYAIPLKLLRIKLIYTEHSTFNKRRKYFLSNLIDAFIYGFYDKIICISTDVRDNLLKSITLFKLEEKCVVINNGICLPVNIKPKNLNLKNKLIVAMIGRFEKPKNQKTLIDFLLISKHNIELHFYGEGPLLNHYMNHVKQSGLNNNVIFHGFVHDLNEKLNNVDVAVLSSDWEGFGLSALETMSLGIPTLGSNVKGLKTVIDNKNLLFEPNNPLSLSKKFDNIIWNPKKYYEYSKYCLERSQEFSINNTVSRLKHEYLDILK